MLYRILGDLEIGPEEQPLAVPTGHRGALLGVLLLNANQRMSTRSLLRAVWGHEDVAKTQLEKHISELRRLLDQLGRREDLVTLRQYGYEMRAAENELDLLLFRKLIRQAEEARSQDRPDDEIDLLRQALRLWRGYRPLASVAHRLGQRAFEDLHQRRRRAAVRLFELELGDQHYDRVVGELATIAEHYQTDGRLSAQLMLALHRTGDSLQAIAVYQVHRDALASRYAADPEAVVHELRNAILRGDEPAVARIETVIAARRPTPAPARVEVPGELPPPPADFLGRDYLVEEASWLLSRESPNGAAVVVISGPGAIGKSALAHFVAHQVREQYPDGQLYAELLGNTDRPLDPTEVLAQFLRSFGVVAVPETLPERVARYRSILANRRVLVVLEDARDEAQVRDLIPGNPTCGVLVTARQRLPDINGAVHVARLEPLPPEIATDLFARLVRRSGIDPTTEPEATARVVTLCAGLPLALCIAAALRSHDLTRSTADLAERLASQPLGAFVYGQRSLARSIGAGLGQLAEDARRLFFGLGLVRIPHIGLWTAAALLPGAGADPAGATAQLAAGHMIEPVESVTHFRLHDLTREYATRRAEEQYPDEADRQLIRERVYGSLLTLARRAHRRIYGGDFEVVHGSIPDGVAPPEVLAGIDRSPLDWFESQRLNIRAAVGHCAELGLVELCWDLAVSSHEFYTIAGYFDDWYATHTEALRACRAAGDSRGEAVVLAILGQPALVTSRRADGLPGPDNLRHAAEVLAGCGDQHGQAIALRTLANALRRRGQLAQPLALFQQALAGYEASGDTVGRWQTLRFIGQTRLDRGDVEWAKRVLRSAMQAAEELGQARLRAQTSYWIGQAHLATEELEQARTAFQVVLDSAGETAGAGHAYAAHGLGDVARLAGDFLAAEDHLGTAARLARETNDSILEGRVQLSIAALHQRQGHPSAQLAALTRAVDCFAGSDAVAHEVAALAALATATASQGDEAAARTARARIEACYAAMQLPPEDRIH